MNAPLRHASPTDRYVELLHVLGFAPLLALTGSLHKALTICALFVVLQCVLIIVTRLCAALLPPRAHLVVALLAGLLCTAIVMQTMLWWQYALTRDLGIYLPLLAVNATLYLNVMRGIGAQTTLLALRGALPGVLAMCGLAVAIALLRTALGDHFAALDTPFGVLILLSLALAAARAWQTHAANREATRT